MKLLNVLTFSAALLISSFSAFAEPVNINQADATSISTNLKGIGLKKAQAIVEYRQKHGAYKTAEDLSMVKGIGVKTVEKNKKDILL